MGSITELMKKVNWEEKEVKVNAIQGIIYMPCNCNARVKHGKASLSSSAGDERDEGKGYRYQPRRVQTLMSLSYKYMCPMPAHMNSLALLWRKYAGTVAA
jgi:hypothetical protein